MWIGTILLNLQISVANLMDGGTPQSTCSKSGTGLFYVHRSISYKLVSSAFWWMKENMPSTMKEKVWKDTYYYFFFRNVWQEKENQVLKGKIFNRTRNIWKKSMYIFSSGILCYWSKAWSKGRNNWMQTEEIYPAGTAKQVFGIRVIIMWIPILWQCGSGLRIQWSTISKRHRATTILKWATRMSGTDSGRPPQHMAYHMCPGPRVGSHLFRLLPSPSEVM